MEILLISVSPVSFMLAKVGDVVEVRKKAPNHKEFRGEKIGSGTVSYLIFKGITKVGMIPPEFIEKHGETAIRKRGKIKRIDAKENILSIEF